MAIERVILISVVALLLGAPPVLARGGNWPSAPSESRQDRIPEGYLPGLSAETGTLCVKQCPNDNLPCDPPVFKIADGRCTTQWR